MSSLVGAGAASVPDEVVMIASRACFSFGIFSASL